MNIYTSKDYRKILSNMMEEKKFLDKKWKVSVIIDATVVGDVVAESFGALIDYKVWYV